MKLFKPEDFCAHKHHAVPCEDYCFAEEFVDRANAKFQAWLSEQISISVADGRAHTLAFSGLNLPSKFKARLVGIEEWE